MEYGGGNDGEGAVDFGLGDGFEEAEAEAAAGAGFIEAHGHEDVGWIGGAGGACGAARDGDVLEVEGYDEGLGINEVEPDVGGVGDAGGSSSVDAGAGDLGEDAGFEAVAELGEAEHCAVGEGVECELGGAAEGHDAGDILSAGATAALVATANLDGVEGGSSADEECADALGGVHFVAADGEEVAAEGFDIDGDFAGGLYGIDVKECAGGAGDGSDFADGLEDAGLIVGEHDGDEAGIGAQGGLDGLGGDKAAGEGVDEGDVLTRLGEFAGGGEDG